MKIRRIMFFAAFFLLPVTLNYFSPVLLVQSSFEGYFTIMHIIYGAMLLSAVVFGSAWCSYVCPFGAVQDILPGTAKKPKLMNSRFPNLKFITGPVFLVLILAPLILSGFDKVNIFYHMEDTKVTMDSFHGLILYYMITGGIILLSVILGKRVWCRYICPMYFFNYIGMSIARVLRLPGLNIKPHAEKCTRCRKCNAACLMGLDVADMAKTGCWNRNECIQCGECVKACKAGTLKQGFTK